MDPFSWLMLAMTGINTVNNLTQEPPTNVIGAQSPGGSGQGALVDAFANAVPQPQGAPNPEEMGLNDEALQAAAEAAAAITQGPPPPVAPLQAPGVGEPGSPQAGPPTSRANPGVSGAPPAASTPASIGEVLAASPEAIASMANLLGLGPQPGTQQRPAPIAGGAPGRVVQGFSQPQTPNIGQLLAQIPRFR